MPEIFPYFQPIVSVESGTIYGYESLGRYREDGVVKSLGGYFGDPAVPNSEKLIADRLIRKEAFARFRTYLDTHEDKPKLFVNVNPSWIVESNLKGKEYPSIVYLREAGLSGKDVVIEITEDPADIESDSLSRFLDPYREAGCKLAVDDFYFDHFERLIAIQPDLVKIDRKLVLKSMENGNYRALMNHIGRFAEELGISVLFEGVETEEQVRLAIGQGARYLQGFAFAPAGEDFIDPDRFKQPLDGSMSSVMTAKYRKAAHAIKLEKELNRVLKGVVSQHVIDGEKSANELLERVAVRLPKECFRLYVCRTSGLQISDNYCREGKEFRFRSGYRGLNWGYRPYFSANLADMLRLSEGVISPDYADIETKRRVQTFSYPLPGEAILFLDFIDLY